MELRGRACGVLRVSMDWSPWGLEKVYSKLLDDSQLVSSFFLTSPR